MSSADHDHDRQSTLSGSRRTPLLSVRDLKVHFPTEDGIVKAVDGLSFDLQQGKTLGIVGESGSGKSVSSLAIMGLHRGTRAEVTGDDPARRDRPARRCATRELRKLRGEDVAMIFQDPLSALHPYYTVGDQIVEAYLVHHDVPKQATPASKTIEMLDRVGIPQPRRGSTTTRTSSPAACASAR